MTDDNKNAENSIKVQIIFSDNADKIEAGEISSIIQSALDVSVKTITGDYKVRILSVSIDPNQTPSIIIKCRKTNSGRLSLILPLMMNLFRLLSFICVGFWIREIGLKYGRNIAMFIIDCYIIIWILIEFILLINGKVGVDNKFNYLILILGCYRIFEILIVYYNILLFDRIKSMLSGDYYAIISSARSVLISIISFFEIALCFAVVYSSLGNAYFKEDSINSIFDYFYFSTVTLTTLGYGDIQPLGAAKFFACLEALVGMMFGLTIVARMISWLPQVKSID